MSHHQRFLIRHALRHLEFFDEEVEPLNTEIRRRLTDSTLAEAFHLLQSIPGIKEESAASILAEIGADMEQFPTAAQLSSWLAYARRTTKALASRRAFVRTGETSG